MIVEQFDSLFYGRRDVFAEGYPDPHKPAKFRYALVREPLTHKVIKQHFSGERCVGVYPLVEDQVGWFAIDFDAPKDEAGNVITEPDPFDVAWESAVQQANAFERAGLHVHLERSRSGKGVHVWGFIDEPVSAGVVRQALKPLLTDHEIFSSRDRMFPMQPTTDNLKEGLGNLIALPFYGGVRAQGFSSFLDASTQEIIAPRIWLASVLRNSAAVITQLAEEAPDETPRSRQQGNGRQSGDPATDYRPQNPSTGVFKVISPYGCAFMRHCWVDRRSLSEPEWYAAIQQATCFRHGREFAHAISRDYKTYDAGATDAKFDQALRNPPVGCAWIHDNYPDNACEGCPMNAVGVKTAPYRLASRPILELVGSSEQPMEIAGSFEPDLKRVERFDRRELESGIPWGIPGLDKFHRLRPSEMTVVGAMQSIGKTHLMVDAAYRLSKVGVPVFVFSAETGRSSLRQRILGRAAEVDTRALRGERTGVPLSDSEWKRLRAASDELEKLPLYLDYTSLDADSVLSQVEDTILRYGVSLDTPYVLFFDYLQFGSKIGEDRTEYDRVTRLSTEFKFTAKVLEKPVVVFSQLIRAAEGDDEPSITWFKNTGRIESDMDAGFIITGERVEGARAPRTIHIVKQREGPANVRIEFMLEQTYGRYDDRRGQMERLPSALGEAGTFGE